MILSLLHHPVLAPTLTAIAGAIFGSFIAALVTRWPRRESVLAGRSRCDHCGAGLRAWELVPITSFVLLRGRCSRCGEPISPDALAVELVAAAIGALAMIAHPGAAGLAMAAFGWLLLPLAWLDLRYFWLPHSLTAALALGAIATAAMGLGPEIEDRLIGGGAGLALLWAVGWSYRRLRGVEGLGGGDCWLFGAIGLWLGWQALPLVLLGASGAGLAAALMLRWRGHAVDAGTRFPLGTLLAMAAWPVALLTQS